jgi:phosphopantetheinyl transferase
LIRPYENCFRGGKASSSIFLIRGDWAVCAVDEDEIGIDIQKQILVIWIQQVLFFEAEYQDLMESQMKKNLLFL